MQNDSRTLLPEVVGETVTRVALDQWSVSIAFGHYSLIIECKWSYTTSSDSDVTLDRDTNLADRVTFELWRVLGSEVLRLEIDDGPLSHLTISLSNGCKIVVHADDDDYEDWHLDWPGGGLMCMGHV